jgi:hypothetical protein
MYHGVDPLWYVVDHIDGDTNNNSIHNLRLATQQENSCNQKLSVDNTSGYKGVGGQGSKWHATIVVNYKRVRIGVFETAELAYQAYCKKAAELHGKFANTGVHNIV